MNNTANFSAMSNATSTQVPKTVAIFVVVLVTICLLAGTFGNARVCVLLRKRQDLRKVPHYLLANLALTGALSSLIHAPLLIVMTTVNYFQIRDLSVADIFCRIGFPSGFFFIVLNALTLWLMALDRQDCVLRPFKRRLTTRNLKKIIPVIWILALVTAILFVVAIRNEPACVKFYPYNSDLSELSNVVITLITVTGQLDNITILIIIVTFIRIIKKMHSSPVNPSSSSTSQRQEKTLTIMTYKICGVFLLCRLPVKIYLLVSRKVGFEGTVAKSIYLIAVASIHLMYVANPFIHHKMLKVGAAAARTAEPANRSRGQQQHNSAKS